MFEKHLTWNWSIWFLSYYKSIAERFGHSCSCSKNFPHTPLQNCKILFEFLETFFVTVLIVTILLINCILKTNLIRPISYISWNETFIVCSEYLFHVLSFYFVCTTAALFWIVWKEYCACFLNSVIWNVSSWFLKHQ